MARTGHPGRAPHREKNKKKSEEMPRNVLQAVLQHATDKSLVSTLMKNVTTMDWYWRCFEAKSKLERDNSGEF